jgi:hypothetical protein
LEKHFQTLFAIRKKKKGPSSKCGAGTALTSAHTGQALLQTCFEVRAADVSRLFPGWQEGKVPSSDRRK